MVRLDAGIPDPRPRQLRDAQQSCRYPTREYQLDRPSLKMAPPRSLSGSSTAIRSPRRGQNQLVSVDKESHINVAAQPPTELVGCGGGLGPCSDRRLLNGNAPSAARASLGR